MSLVPDKPVEIQIQRARQQFMTEKAVLKIADDKLGVEEDIDSVDGVDAEGNSPKVFDIHTYHKSYNDVRAKFRSTYRSP